MEEGEQYTPLNYARCEKQLLCGIVTVQDKEEGVPEEVVSAKDQALRLQNIDSKSEIWQPISQCGAKVVTVSWA